ncbi:putative ABC transport system permease protein [Herbihabitans rhizosphaerae]|uniref:Putative ABC transport system permease protein n=1 Tax=Herbihabitans rhizosphaerae TaxID=1872711 RepID=A0A4V2ESB8_9PSEU|nr:FtsX-like permease family protein [Herbihabitans rhizosphaerae]RZS37023.1 putative ABC transport system permease protein [Herbihabitans rhizosphaerae]
MLKLSLRTFAERWQLFVGSIITVMIGVALVQSSLLILISLATYEPPASIPMLQQIELANAYEGGIALLGVTTGFSVFLTAFIVSSTFAFTVSQRRQDLALLRLVGGSRGNVRRLLLSEAAVLGSIGTALGIPFGLLTMELQTNLLISLQLVPEGFTPDFQFWIVAVAIGVGVGIAIAGVYVAARRASKVRPLEALRESGDVRKVMSPGRWIAGLFCLFAALAMTILSALLPSVGAMAVGINAALVASIAMAALSPVVVPLVARIFGFLFRGGLIGTLAQANLRDGVRRSAATAAPLLVLVAMLLAQWGSSETISDGAAEQARRDTRGDLVVSTQGAAVPAIARTSGVELVSPESQVPLTSTFNEVGEVEEPEEPEEGEAPKAPEPAEVITHKASAVATAVDPVAYQRTHVVPMAEGSLADLRGATVAVGAFDTEQTIKLGTMIEAKIGDHPVKLKVVALLPDSIGGGATMLLPRDVVPADVLAAAPTQTVVHLAGGADQGAVVDKLREQGGEVTPMAAWLAETSKKNDQQQTKISTVVMGLSGLYALIAVINAVVIGAAARRREFAAARVSGLRRSQVVRMALVESWGVTAIGLVLGALAAVTTLIGIGASTARITGSGGVTIPWLMVGLVVLGAFVVVGCTSIWTALSATRARPVTLIGARE